MDFNQIFVVTVNWNLKDDTVACIRSVVAAGIPEANIILVDNGSRDDSVAFIQQQFQAITIIQNEQNVGFAVANNIGIARALEKSAQWVCLLNNDTVVSPEMFENICGVHLHRKADVYGPEIRYFDESARIWYLGDVRIPGTLFSRSLWKNKISPAKMPNAISVDFVSGCGVIVSSAVFETVGTFDPAFFMYGEDADLMWRIRKAGFAIVAVPDALMWHKVSRSAGKDLPATRYWKIRNQIRFYRLHSHGAKRVVMFVLSTLRAAIIATRDVFFLRRKLLAPLARGWLDGWHEANLFEKVYQYGNRNV